MSAEAFQPAFERALGDLRYLGPELAVVAAFLGALIYDLLVGRTPAGQETAGHLAGQRRGNVAPVLLFGFLVALHLLVPPLIDPCLGLDVATRRLALASPYRGQGEIRLALPLFGGMVILDRFSLFFRLLILLGTVISLLMALHSRALNNERRNEFLLLLTATCLSGMLLAGARHLLLIYLALEFLSLTSYALAGYQQHDAKSSEAGIKYVLYGALSSAVMLFGMSYLFGLTGEMNLELIAAKLRAITSPEESRAVGAMVLLVFVGFAYKIAAVPFHFWTPDVYEGAPTVATAFFSVVPKAAGFAVLVRTLFAFLEPGAEVSAGAVASWWGHQSASQLLWWAAALTMTLGNLAALGQTNAKRMLAYSAIAHAGYMLAALSVLHLPGKTGSEASGLPVLVFYLAVYLFMNLGAFLVLVALENAAGSAELRDLRGSVHREPLLVVAMCVFLFSLTGLPPLGGFVGKWLIFEKLLSSARPDYALALLLAGNTVISLFYYIKIMKALIVEEPEAELSAAAPSALVFRALAVGLALCVFYLGIGWQGIYELSKLVAVIV